MMSESGDSLPHIPPDSPGSSVSSRLQEEYDELLKYAVVLPNYEPGKSRHILSDARLSFPLHQSEGEGDPDRRSARDDVLVTRDKSDLPDFNQSPIQPKDDHKQKQDDSDQEHSEKSTPRVSSHYSSPRQTYFPEERIEREEERYVDEVVYTSTIDPDVAKMENVLDQWTLDLKRNVLAEFGQSKIRIIEKSRQELQKETEREVKGTATYIICTDSKTRSDRSEITERLADQIRYNIQYIADKNQMINEIDKLKELLHTYEQSIERKDQVISNLTQALNKQKEKCEMLKKFSEWKLRHNDIKREAFASNLAQRHYERSLSSKVWAAWHSVIETKWRQRVEKACQAKAQDVCRQLTTDYEERISKLNEALEAAHVKIGRMNVERERYEEAMKKAFMRGVCALNLEAMTMFHGEEGEEEGQEGKRSIPDDISENLESFAPDKDYGGPKTIPQEAVYSSRLTDPAPSRVVTSQGARSSSTTVSQSRASTSSRPTSAHSRGKVVSAKITGKVDSGKSARNTGTTLAPPMASVIVERHQPVTKQTVGKATASKYPASQSGHIFKRLAGQGSPVTLSPHIQSVKVVD